MSSESDRRRLPRHQLDLQVELVEIPSGNSLGLLVNIHTEGLLMMGEMSLQPDHLYQVQLRPLSHTDILSPVNLVMDCLWTRAMGQQDRLWAGCQIVDLSLEDMRNLAALIDRFSHKTDELSCDGALP
ncbi:MAG: hypothetical protein R3E57_10935 [Porticoccaceae bacterium]